MNEHVVTAIVAVVSSVGTYLATRLQSQYSLQGKRMESDSATEGIYVQNMEMILREYKEQVSGFRADVELLRNENKKIKAEFKKFKDEAEKEKEKERVFYTTEIEKRDDRIEELGDIIVEKDEIIETLKGEE